MEESAAELQRSAEKVGAERHKSSFGQLIAQAVKRRLPRHTTASASTSSEQQHETFADKLKRKVKQHAAGRRVTMRANE
jgi:hypothetical protein